MNDFIRGFRAGYTAAEFPRREAGNNYEVTAGWLVGCAVYEAHISSLLTDENQIDDLARRIWFFTSAGSTE